MAAALAARLADAGSPHGGAAAALKGVAERRDSNAGLADQALAIVRDFVAERKLLLYGGQMLDYALRLKGDAVYPPGQRPDYDAYSPDPVRDAYDLADALAAKGYPRAVAAPAIHAQTMRVKVDFIYVADLTYVPPSIFARLRYLEYGDLRVVHPDHQRLDMHLAFCFPLANPPFEDIFHRFKKDAHRLALLDRYYPVEADTFPEDKTGFASKDGAVSEARRVEHVPPGVAIHGFLAYALLRRAYDEYIAALAPAASVSAASASAASAAELDGAVETVADGPRAGELRLSLGPVPGIPAARAPIVVATPWPGAVREAVGGEWSGYDPYLDHRPTCWVGGGAPLHVYSTENRLLAVRWLRPGIAVVAYPYLLLYFLHWAEAIPDPATAAVYRRFYRHTWDLVTAARGAAEAAEAAGAAGAARRLFEASPFALSVETLGDQNVSPALRVLLARARERLAVARAHAGESPPAEGATPPAGTRPRMVPALYAPPKKRPLDFVYGEVFRFGGGAIGSPADAPPLENL